MMESLHGITFSHAKSGHVEMKQRMIKLEQVKKLTLRLIEPSNHEALPLYEDYVMI